MLAMSHAEKFKTLGHPRAVGVLLYGPPGTGKTLIVARVESANRRRVLARRRPRFSADVHRRRRQAGERRVRARQDEGAGDHLHRRDRRHRRVQMFSTSDTNGDREARTMLELLNQKMGFRSDDRVKIIAATNRVGHSGPRASAVRSYRIRRSSSRTPTRTRARRSWSHARKMNVSGEVNYEARARATDDFNAAQLKAVCVEAGMLALRRDGTEVNHEDFNEGIIAVQAKKKADVRLHVMVISFSCVEISRRVGGVVLVYSRRAPRRVLRDERPSARLHLLKRDGSHFPPIELPAGVDGPDPR